MFGSLKLEITPPESLVYIEVINGRWSVNKKSFKEMTLKERQLLDEKIKY